MPKNFTWVAFVNAWQTSSSHKEIASKLGVSTEKVRRSATTLKLKGVPLKRYEGGRPKGTSQVDWDLLKRLAAELSAPATDEEAGKYIK